MTPFGISLSIGFAEGWPSLVIQRLPLTTLKPRAVYESHSVINDFLSETDGFGLRFDLVAGKLRRPIPPFWRLDYWKNRSKYNPWTSGRHACVLSIPFVVGFLFALCIPIGNRKQPGIYFGLKSYRVDGISNRGKWADPSEDGNFYLCNSASWRHDLVE